MKKQFMNFLYMYIYKYIHTYDYTHIFFLCYVNKSIFAIELRTVGFYIVKLTQYNIFTMNTKDYMLSKVHMGRT